jgi:hypothetical protein
MILNINRLTRDFFLRMSPASGDFERIIFDLRVKIKCLPRSKRKL